MSMFKQHRQFRGPPYEVPVMMGGIHIMTTGNLATFKYTIHALKVVDGRKFKIEVECDEFDGLDEDDLARKVYVEMMEEISRFKAITNPVPNGPEHAVWLAECLTQAELAESHEEATNWIRRRRAARGQP